MGTDSSSVALPNQGKRRGKDLRILYGGVGHPSFVHMSGKFSEELSKLGIEFREVNADKVCSGFPETRPREWLLDTRLFREIVNEFKPDFVMTDHLGHFGLAAIGEGIPLLIYLRLDYWKELQWLITNNTSKKPFDKFGNWWRMQNANKCFRRSSLIISISKYLDGVVKARFPQKPTAIMHQGIDPEAWQSGKEDGGMDLNHPCVGFVQYATVYKKTAEMLVLSRVMAALPEVTFYWGGDGPYRDTVLPELSKHDNFEWLGNLERPADVRRFMYSVDIYGLASGQDMLPTTVLEAQMARRPVIATRVGGVPEMVVEEITGLLVERGDHVRWIEHIDALLGDEKRRRNMGAEGRKFVGENFTARTMAQQFRDAIDKVG